MGVSRSATEVAAVALENVEEVLSKLPRDEGHSKALPITVADLNKGVQVAENQRQFNHLFFLSQSFSCDGIKITIPTLVFLVNEAKESIPYSSAITESLGEKRPMFDDMKAQLASDITELKAKIAAARELANRVPVGMNFVESSSLLVGNPQTLESQQVESKISLFFKTQDPDGLILFMGNEPGRKPEV